MNYLLHCWLGRSEAGLKAGGFLGDFIKGRLHEDIPDSLTRGIRLHRHIDIVSNHLPAMKTTYHRFGTELRRPAPILLDLVADHVFAKRWHDYCDYPITEFTKSCYRDIGKFEIPNNAETMYEHMCRTDLFARYSDETVMVDIMKRILKRLKFDHLTGQIDTVMHECANDFEEDFKIYYPALESEVASFLEEMA